MRWTVGKVLRIVVDGAVRIGRLGRQQPSLPHLGIGGGKHLGERSDVVAW